MAKAIITLQNENPDKIPWRVVATYVQESEQWCKDRCSQLHGMVGGVLQQTSHAAQDRTSEMAWSGVPAHPLAVPSGLQCRDNDVGGGDNISLAGIGSVSQEADRTNAAVAESRSLKDCAAHSVEEVVAMLCVLPVRGLVFQDLNQVLRLCVLDIFTVLGKL